MTLRSGRVAGSKNVAPQKDMGMMTKLLPDQHFRAIRIQPTITPNPEKQHNSVPATAETRVEKTPDLMMNSTATRITEPGSSAPHWLSRQHFCQCTGAKDAQEQQHFLKVFW